MCRQWENTGTCDRTPCKFSHSWEEYFSSKPRDLPRVQGYVVQEPYVVYAEPEEAGPDEVSRSIDLHTVCPVYLDLGYCPFAWRCRFLGGHVKKAEGGVGGWALAEMKDETPGWKNGETNWPNMQVLSKLRKATVSLTLT
jgi:tRNA-dihydrouridine synthase 3